MARDPRAGDRELVGVRDPAARVRSPVEARAGGRAPVRAPVRAPAEARVLVEARAAAGAANSKTRLAP